MELDLEKTIKEVLALMNVAVDLVEKIENPLSKHVRFVIHTKDASALIGTNGEHLGAFNYVIRRMVAKKAGVGAPTKFIIDVNGYQDKAVENLKAKAKIMSDRARSFKVDIEMDPMSSYERMLIHSFLEGQPDVKTESKGDGAQRRVVIRYIAQS